MQKRIFLLYLFFIASIVDQANGQSLSRSNAIGLRVSFWNMANKSFNTKITADSEKTAIDLSGIGVWLYLFSRVHNNWHLSFEMGTAGNITGEENVKVKTGSAEGSAVFAILFGLRYDLLSSKIPSTLQPYIMAGAGPYWISQFKSVQQTGRELVTNQTALKYSGYAGSGMNVVLTSWFALNFNFRYHFVDFAIKHGYSGFEFGLGANLMWGKKREIFEIRDIKLVVKDIYPVYYEFYNTYPLALVTIRNVAGYPIEVNVRSFIQGYSERPKESGFIKLKGGETRDIPVTAIFSPAVLDANRRQPATLDLSIEARPGTTVVRQIHAQLIVHTRQAWNGEIEKLKFYITPDDKNVIEKSKAIVEAAGVDFSDNVKMARALFTHFNKLGLTYRNDPNIPFYQDDRVQSALETLESGGGDCDDLTVLYASFLQSLGIRTAFVEVRDPKKEIAHLYILFDTGLGADMGETISSNEKKYIIRQNDSGRSSIWIPVETTLVSQNFDEAWRSGAFEYQEEAVLRNGLAERWVNIYDNQ